MESEYKYYVYHVFLEDEVVYIGKGAGNRYKHATSGKSHNYGLNKVWFSFEFLRGIEPIVRKMCYFKTEEDSLFQEGKDIAEILPTCNIRGKCNSRVKLYGDVTLSRTNPLTPTLLEYVEYALCQDNCRHLIYQKMYYSKIGVDKLLLEQVLYFLPSGNEEAHNKTEFKKKYKTNKKEGKALNSFTGRIRKKAGREPSEEELLNSLTKYRIKNGGILPNEELN